MLNQTLTKSEFEIVEREYYANKKRFENIHKGDLIWKPFIKKNGMGYSPVVVKSVNVDERYVQGIAMDDDNGILNYYTFFTEGEILKEGFSKRKIREQKSKYKKVIDSLFEPTDVLV